MTSSGFNLTHAVVPSIILARPVAVCHSITHRTSMFLSNVRLFSIRAPHFSAEIVVGDPVSSEVVPRVPVIDSTY